MRSADAIEKDEQINPQIIKLIKEMIKKGTPAIVNRGKKLINRLKRDE